MDFLFIHGNSGFCLAEWCLRDALSTDCSVSVNFHAVEIASEDFAAQERARQLVAALQPKLIGFSCHAWTIACYVEMAAWFKHLSPTTRIVFGGPHVGSTAAAEMVCDRWRNVDYVIRGPGEKGLSRLVEAASGQGDFTDVPGLTCRDGERVVHNPATKLHDWSREIIFHEGNLPLAHRLDGLFQASYETMRGCSNRCLYCVYPGDGVACLDEAVVFRELEFLLAFHIPHLRICDAHFGGSRSRAKSFLRHLTKVNRATSVKIYPALDHVDTEYVSLVADAGAEITSIGIQTTNPAALKAIRRPPNHEHEKTISLLLKEFPYIPADLIVGLPGDDMEGLEKSFLDVLELGFARVNVFRLTAFPATPLSENVAAHLGGTQLFHTSSGQILSSPSFPPKSQRGVAALCHAVEVAAPLRQTRNALRRTEKTDLCSRLAHGITPDSLILLKWLITEARPGEVLKRLSEILAHMDPALNHSPELGDALLTDVLDVLRRRFEVERQLTLQWPTEQGAKSVSTVVVALSGETHVVWDITAATLTTHSRLPASLELNDPHCLYVDHLYHPSDDRDQSEQK